MTLDAFTLALLPRDVHLVITSRTIGFTCAICGCKHYPYEWRVKLPNRAGMASISCAVDAGFTVE